MDTRDGQLWRVTRKAYSNWLTKVRSAAVVRFFERHVVDLEKQLRMGDQHGFFQNIKLVQLEEVRRRSNHSASVTRKADCCATKGVSARDGCDSFARC